MEHPALGDLGPAAEQLEAAVLPRPLLLAEGAGSGAAGSGAAASLQARHTSVGGRACSDHCPIIALHICLTQYGVSLPRACMQALLGILAAHPPPPRPQSPMPPPQKIFGGGGGGKDPQPLGPPMEPQPASTAPPHGRQTVAHAALSSRRAASWAQPAQQPPPAPARSGPARRTLAVPALSAMPPAAPPCLLAAPPALNEAVLRRTLGEEQQLPLSLLRRLVYA